MRVPMTFVPARGVAGEGEDTSWRESEWHRFLPKTAIAEDKGPCLPKPKEESFSNPGFWIQPTVN